MNEEKRDLGSFGLFALWFGEAAISMAEIFTGGLLAPFLGFSDGVKAIIIGHLIGGGIMLLAAREDGLPAIMSTRISFSATWLVSFFDTQYSSIDWLDSGYDHCRRKSGQ